MSQGVLWTRGPVCGVDNCRSRVWRSNAGLKYCQYGHMMEGNIEFDDEDGDAFTQTKRLNIQVNEDGYATNSTPSTGLTKADKRLYGEEGRAYHWVCLQNALQNLMSRTLDHLYAYLQPEALQLFKTRVSRATKLLWMRCVRVSQGHKSPVVLDLLAVVYLALRQVNQYPVYLDDYLAMMKNNKIPLLHGFSLISPQMLEKCPLKTIACLSVKAIPMEDRFIRLIQRWTFKLKVRVGEAIPMHDFYPLAFKTFRALKLPHAPSLLAQYHEFCADTTGGFLVLRNTTVSPELRCIALMFYVLRLHFRHSPQVVDPQPWKSWLSAQRPSEFPFTSESYQSMDMNTLLDLSDRDVSRYSEWVFDALVPEKLKGGDGSLSVMEKKIHSIFKYSRDNEPPHEENTEFACVDNTLTWDEKSQIEHVLMSYFVSRFGVRAQTLSIMASRIQRDLYCRMKKRNMLKPLSLPPKPKRTTQKHPKLAGQ